MTTFEADQCDYPFELNRLFFLQYQLHHMDGNPSIIMAQKVQQQRFNGSSKITNGHKRATIKTLWQKGNGNGKRQKVMVKR